MATPTRARKAATGRRAGKATKAPARPRKAKAASARTRPAVKTAAAKPSAPSPEVDARIHGPGDWRGDALARLRALIRDADPAIAEDIKWRKPSNPAGVVAWSHGGLVCTGETYKDKVKLTFAHGAALPDPARVFNASLDAGTRRAIDVHEGGRVDEAAFKELVRAAVALNTAQA